MDDHVAELIFESLKDLGCKYRVDETQIVIYTPFDIKGKNIMFFVSLNDDMVDIRSYEFGANDSFALGDPDFCGKVRSFIKSGILSGILGCRDRGVVFEWLKECL